VRVGDAVDEVIAEVPFGPVRFAAINALGAAFERCAPEYYGGGPACARQMSGESIADVRAALVAALAAFDSARLRCPSGPLGVAGSKRALNRNVVPARAHFE